MLGEHVWLTLRKWLANDTGNTPWEEKALYSKGKKVLNRLDYKQIPRINRVHQNMYFLKNDRKKKVKEKKKMVREAINIVKIQ